MKHPLFDIKIHDRDPDWFIDYVPSKDIHDYEKWCLMKQMVGME
jgi:hypothetical protein